MIKQSPQLRELVRKRKGDLYFANTFSKMEALSKDSGSMDGLNSHCVVIDELHGIKDRNLYEVMKQSQSARRQPLLIMITTAGTIRENIFDEMYATACNIVDGVFKDDTFLPILYELCLLYTSRTHTAPAAMAIHTITMPNIFIFSITANSFLGYII